MPATVLRQARSPDRRAQGCCSAPAKRLQTAFLNEALLDRRDVRLAIAKRVRRRVDRVVAGDEIVLVRSGRAENELGIGQRFEFHRFARRLESREIPVPQFVRRRHRTPDAMATQRTVWPAGGS